MARHEHDWAQTAEFPDDKQPEVKITEYECKTEKEKDKK